MQQQSGLKAMAGDDILWATCSRIPQLQAWNFIPVRGDAYAALINGPKMRHPQTDSGRRKIQCAKMNTIWEQLDFQSSQALFKLQANRRGLFLTEPVNSAFFCLWAKYLGCFLDCTVTVLISDKHLHALLWMHKLWEPEQEAELLSLVCSFFSQACSLNVNTLTLH